MMNFRSANISLLKIRPLPSAIMVAAALVAFLLSPTALRAQQGKDIAKDLLRALIESQLERQGVRNDFGPPTQRPAQPTAEMQQVRTLLATLQQEAVTLATLLTTDARRSLDVREHQADAFAFQTSAAAVRQRADRETSHAAFKPVLQSLDQSWRMLAHDVAHCPGTSQQSRDCAGRITQLDAQLCQLLDIREQFNSRELVRAADLLAADLKTLTEEVTYSGALTSGRTRLIANLRRLQDRATYFAGLAADGVQFQTVVAEYQTLYQSWLALRPELDAFPARGVVRTAARVQDTHRTIHQLLRLEFGIDLASIQHMSEALERELTDLYRALTLEQLMTLPDSRSLPVLADTLLGTAHNLTDVVTRREALQTIGEAWAYTDEQWQLFEYYLRPAAAPETRRRVEGIAQSLDSLKRTIGVSVAFDHNAIVRQAATVESLADVLQTTVRRWLNRPGQTNAALAAEVQQLVDRCRQLDTLAASARDRVALNSKCDEVLILWEQLRPKLSTCATDEREAIERLVDSYTPAIVQLHTMLEN